MSEVQTVQAETVAPARRKVKKPARRKVKKPARRRAPSKAVAIRAPTPPTVAAPRNFLQVIAEAALNPACDVAKMQALLDMQRQIEDREERKAFTVAFNALQAELPVINRDGKIDHSSDGGTTTRTGRKALKTAYATYPNLNRVCGPLLKKHGFTFSSSMEPEASGTSVIISTLEHIAGGSRSTRFRLTADATGGKNNQQGWGSSQQYGMRYNMIALLNIVTEAKEDADNDGFAQSPEISKAQLAKLTAVCKEVNANIDAFCGVMKVETLADIPASRFDEAMMQLERKRKAQQKKQNTKSDFPGDNPLE